MSDIALAVGPVIFQDFEVSSGIGWGGEQRLAVHKLPGGARVIDALGRDDAEITLSGIFSGQDATLRARLLDEMRALGTVLPLTWDVFFYSVVVRAFEADYRNAYWIPYRLHCTVLRDEASALVETALSLASAVLSDVATAAAQSLGGLDLSGAVSCLSASGATTLGTSAYAQALTSLSSAQSAIGGALEQSGASVSSAGQLLTSTADPLAGSAAVWQAAGAAGQLSGLATARAYVGRAAINLSNAST
jgi:hypothetical protein